MCPMATHVYRIAKALRLAAWVIAAICLFYAIRGESNFPLLLGAIGWALCQGLALAVSCLEIRIGSAKSR